MQNHIEHTRVKKVTPWQQFLNDYGKTAGKGLHFSLIHTNKFSEGKAAMKDFKTFSRNASCAYKLLRTPEKDELKKRSHSQAHFVLDSAAVKRGGTKIFNHIQKKVFLRRFLKPYSHTIWNPIPIQ